MATMPHDAYFFLNSEQYYIYVSRFILASINEKYEVKESEFCDIRKKHSVLVSRKHQAMKDNLRHATDPSRTRNMRWIAWKTLQRTWKELFEQTNEPFPVQEPPFGRPQKFANDTQMGRQLRTKPDPDDPKKSVILEEYITIKVKEGINNALENLIQAEVERRIKTTTLDIRTLDGHVIDLQGNTTTWAGLRQNIRSGEEEEDRTKRRKTAKNPKSTKEITGSDAQEHNPKASEGSNANVTNDTDILKSPVPQIKQEM